MAIEAITDKKFEALARKSSPIGCLAERHPELLFASVLEVEGVLCAVFMGGIAKLQKGTKVKLWDGTIIEA